MDKKSELINPEPSSVNGIILEDGSRAFSFDNYLVFPQTQSLVEIFYPNNPKKPVFNADSINFALNNLSGAKFGPLKEGGSWKQVSDPVEIETCLVKINTLSNSS